MDYQSLHNKTVTELREIAKEMNVRIPSKVNKMTIITLLLEAEARAAAGKPPVAEVKKPVQAAVQEEKFIREPKTVEHQTVEETVADAKSVSEKPEEKPVDNVKTPEFEAGPVRQNGPEERVQRPNFVRTQSRAPRALPPRSTFVRTPRTMGDVPAERPAGEMARRTPETMARRPVMENPYRSAAPVVEESSGEAVRRAPETVVRRPMPDGYRRPMTPVAAEESSGEFVRRGVNYEYGPDGAPIGDFADGSGLLEIQPEGHGFLRAENCLPGSRDAYISNAQIRRFNLRNGDYVEGKTRPQREGDRYVAMIYINRINGEPPEKALQRKPFDALVPVYPSERLRMESGKNHDLSLRLIDILAPIGKGQRGLIVSQPKAGKTTLLKKVANAISENNPEVKLIVLLIDERPEEVTDMKRSIKGDVIYSTFDENPENHTRVSEMVLEHAQRMVEMGKDVVILLDSITRLARAYNLVIPPTGRSLSGGLDPGALYRPKKFFGAARNIENGGSLTIIATALVDTGSRMDDIIYEEFKGTGNMELHLDRRLSDKRIFPAIDLVRSGTRREELLLTSKELEGAYTARKMLSGGNLQQSAETLIGLVEKSANNDEFLGRIKGWAGMYEKDGFSLGGR